MAVAKTVSETQTTCTLPAKVPVRGEKYEQRSSAGNSLVGEHPVERGEAEGGLGTNLYEKHIKAKNAPPSSASITHRARGQEVCKYQLFTFTRQLPRPATDRRAGAV